MKKSISKGTQKLFFLLVLSLHTNWQKFISRYLQISFLFSCCQFISYKTNIWFIIVYFSKDIVGNYWKKKFVTLNLIIIIYFLSWTLKKILSTSKRTNYFSYLITVSVDLFNVFAKVIDVKTLCLEKLMKVKREKKSYLCRSSHRRCSVRKYVLKDFSKFTGKHLCARAFF